MALLFMDGFDHYATADITKKWTSNSGGNATINATAGRRGGGACLVPNAANFLTKVLPASSSWIMGFAFSLGALPPSGAGVYIAALFDAAGDMQCGLQINPNGTLGVSRPATNLTNGTSTNSIAPNEFNYIEWKVTIADSIGADTCKVRVNGQDWITVATGQDTKATTIATASILKIGNLDVTKSLGSCKFDDLYICNGAGSTNNDFLGDVRVDTLFPNADGSYSQFAPSSGTAHYLLVDESAPNTTDYNASATVGDRDSYAFQDLAPLVSQIVYGVQASAAVYKDDTGGRSVAPFIRLNSANDDGTALALSTSMQYASALRETKPGGGAWTAADVNAAEFGVRVSA